MSDALAWTFAAHALLGLLLGLNVIRLRWKHRVGIGDGGNREMVRAVRVHANFAEWTPLALLLLLAAELRSAPPDWVAGLGLALLLGRVGHAIGLSRGIGPSVGRSGGMTLTMIVILAAAGLALRGGGS